METPLRFSVNYVCKHDDCGEEYVIENCLVPRLTLPCEGCGGLSVFYAESMLHKSWEWDTIELFELEGEMVGQPSL